MLVSSLRLDVLSGSLSLLCAIKFVFASLLRLDVTDRLTLGALASRVLFLNMQQQSFARSNRTKKSTSYKKKRQKKWIFQILLVLLPCRIFIRQNEMIN